MLDYLEIFKAFNAKKIKYIVVGGMAVNFHGIPRMTYDIDILLDLTDSNLKKFLALIKKWNFKPKVPVNIMDFSNKNKRMEWIKHKNMKAFNLVNPEWAVSEIDIIIDSPVDYSRAKKHVQFIQLQGAAIPTISISDLIIMKKKAQRKQDESDIRLLKKVSHA